MISQAAALFDPGALVVVLAGTLLATTARCGWSDLKTAMAAISQLWSAGFDADANRAAIARTIKEIARRGHLCADITLPPDKSTAKLVHLYVASGQFELFHTTARADRAAREITRARAVRVFEFAGELAPVFGLVGTLFAITQLAPGDMTSAAEVTMAAVATAVLSSLYGVLVAHLVCIPLAQAIERRGEREEEERASLIDWFRREISGEHDARPRSLADAA